MKAYALAIRCHQTGQSPELKPRAKSLEPKASAEPALQMSAGDGERFKACVFGGADRMLRSAKLPVAAKSF